MKNLLTRLQDAALRWAAPNLFSYQDRLEAAELAEDELRLHLRRHPDLTGNVLKRGDWVWHAPTLTARRGLLELRLDRAALQDAWGCWVSRGGWAYRNLAEIKMRGNDWDFLLDTAQRWAEDAEAELRLG